MRDDEVSDLKKSIRSERELDSLKDVVFTLELYKVSAIDEPLREMTLLCFSQLKDQLSAAKATPLRQIPAVYPDVVPQMSPLSTCSSTTTAGWAPCDPSCISLHTALRPSQTVSPVVHHFQSRGDGTPGRLGM